MVRAAAAGRVSRRNYHREIIVVACRRSRETIGRARRSGRTLDVASLFIAGKSDWGTYQFPGTFERMQRSACTRMLGCHLVDGAGHWVQQEQPEQVTALLLEFLQQCPR
jgi:pimeloyl-ACP methyl ester carboxylesterase